MYKLKNLKHIFVIVGIVFLTILLSISPLFSDISIFLNKSFVYNNVFGSFPERLYSYHLAPEYDTNNRTRVVIVTIDEASLNYLDANNIPFGKGLYTTILERLQRRGQVKGIGFDLIFSIPDTASSNTRWLTSEEEFVETMKKYKNIVIAADYDNQFCANTLNELRWLYPTFDYTSEETYPGLDTTNCNKRLAGILVTNKDKLTSFHLTKRFTDFFVAYENKKSLDNFTDVDYQTLYCQKDDGGKWKYMSCLNVPRSLYANIPWGTINIDLRQDVSYSRMAMSFLSGDLPYASWKASSGSLSQNKYLYSLPIELYRLTGGDMSVIQHVMDSSENVLNPYFGPELSFTMISLKDVLQYSDSQLYGLFAWKYVLIGDSQKVNGDSVESPVTGGDMIWVELHAHFLEGLLQNKMLKKIPPEYSYGGLILLVILSVFLYFLMNKFLSPIIAIIVLIATVWLVRYGYEVQRVVVDIFPFFVAGIGSYIVTYVYKFFVVDREKRELQSNFWRYVDPLVVKKIADGNIPIELGGEKRELSILFSDIAGFTTISEQLPPQELFYIMASYLSRMTDILIGEGWTLDKYIGDAIMGFFWAPLPFEDHAIRACRTAIRMQERLPDFNAEIIAHGLEPIHFRVGIASGEVMVGNIGSRDRFNYTVLGDTVNLASRLEGTGKEYEVLMIISNSIREKLTPDFIVRELDTIAVKWKTEGVRIFELVGFAQNVREIAVYQNYEKALAHYRKWEYREAGDIWASQMDFDPPSKIMAQRSAAILRHEVAVENGVYHMTHK